MLTDRDFDILATPIIDLYSELERTIINDMARRITNADFASAAWQLNRIQESGAIYQNVIKELSLITGKSEQMLKSIFTKYGAKPLFFDDKIYRAAGLNPIPLRLSKPMLNVLIAGLNKTNGVIRNLTLTTALSAQTQFIAATDQAYLAVTSGVLDYNTAIRNAIRNIGGSGLKVIYPSGHQDFVDTAVRRATLTGVGQTAAQLQLTRMDEMGADLVATSEHVGARPEHVIWQGKIFSRSGTSRKYPDFVTSTGYGTVTGLAGVNCRHSFYVWYDGISKNAYDEATRNEEDARTVTVGGKEMPLYDALQYQRSIERKIREWKRRAGALDAAGLDAGFERGKVSQWQGRMRQFIKDSNLRREYIREKV